MSIFNSLGSNYTFEFVLETLSAGDKESSKLLLKKFLEEYYSGDAVLVYKGREALQLALRSIALKNTTVGVCGFTCFAVYDAVAKEGYTAEYLDIDESLQFSFETFKKAAEKNPALKVLIIQNTLGFPCDIEKIAKYCREKNIILIEDLAHSIGANYDINKQAGTVGDYVVLSFSQDKMIDGISGGALITRTQASRHSNHKDAHLSHIAFQKQKRDRLYPLFTFLIRKTYASGFGKALHLLLKKRKLLTQPMDNLDNEHIFELPNWYCQLILSEYHQLDKNLKQRKKIAKIYAETLNNKVQEDSIVEKIPLSANLRYPIFVPNRDKLIAFLKQSSIYVSDIWYDAPIGPKKYMARTNYKGECPVSEKVSERIINLPTHRNVTETQAKFIAEKVNEWLKQDS
jgi:dTDP-4-amino-4,6-dideoxygalactose transaminase